MSNVDKVFRVVDCNGEPVDYRNNDRRNLYKAESHAKSAATQFNNTTLFYHGEDAKLEGYPYTVQEGKVEWQ